MKKYIFNKWVIIEVIQQLSGEDGAEPRVPYA